MQTVKVERSKLLEILRENKTKYTELYNKAVEGYWKEAEDVLKAQLDKLAKKEKVDASLDFPYPIDYSEQFDTVIQMVELSISEEITLTHAEFLQYVRNKWNWLENFSVSNSRYLTKAGY